MHAFSVDDYHRLAAAGVLAGGQRVELIEGCVFDMAPIGAPHATSVQKTLAAFWNLPLASLPTGWHIRVQQPLTLGRSEPQPDLAIVRRTPDDYSARHPGAGDVALVIEVADASLAFDRGQKLAAYAAEGIAEYWIVDVIRRQIEVHRHPESDAQASRFATHLVVDANAQLRVVIDGKEIGQLRVRDLLP